ncbi:hypothetical protein [Hoeflea sp.]|uniref:hypothetical protein n=1 Tax=Hoeflea sp. TaxID=1940281 RepID=UPI003749B8A8
MKMPFNIPLKAWLGFLLFAGGLLAFSYLSPDLVDENGIRSPFSLETQQQAQTAGPLTGQAAQTPLVQNTPSPEAARRAQGTSWSAAFASIAIMALALIAVAYGFSERGEKVRGKVTHGLTNTSMYGWAVWAAIFLSISSLATTYLGMANFHVHWIFALVSATGIQILLFISSWIFAEALANRRHLKRLIREGEVPEDSLPFRQAQAKSDGGVLLMASAMVAASMGVSVFFSLDSLFDTVYLPENRQLTNMKVARSDMGGVFDKLRDKVDVANANELSELTDSEAWRDWRRNVDTVMTAAGNAKNVIAQAIQLDRSNAKTNLDSAIAEATKAGEEVARLAAQLAAQGSEASDSTAVTDQFQSRIAGKEQEVSDARKQVNDLEAEVADWDAKIEEEINAGGVDENGNRRATGCGRVCRSLQREKAAVEARLSTRKNRLASLEADLQSIRGEQESALSSRKEIEARLVTARASETAAKAALDAAQRTYDRVYQSNANVGDPGQAGGPVDAIRASISKFLATASVSSLQPAIDSCEAIYETMNANASTRAGIANVSCDITAIAPSLDQMRAHETAKATMATDCRVDDEFIAFTQVRQMIDKARKCISLSGLSYDAVADERELADKVEQENSENSSRFEITLSTLTRGDLLSWLTLFIAFSIDLFVLASAVVGARTMESVLEEDGDVGSKSALDRIELLQFAHSSVRSDDPPNIRTQKHFLTALEHETPGHGTDSEQILDLNSQRVHSWGEEATKTLSLQMSSLVAQGLAFPVPGRPGAYRIKQNYVSHVTFQVARYEKDYHARNKGNGNDSGGNGPNAAGGFQRHRNGYGQAFVNGNSGAGGQNASSGGFAKPGQNSNRKWRDAFKKNRNKSGKKDGDDDDQETVYR